MAYIEVRSRPVSGCLEASVPLLRAINNLFLDETHWYIRHIEVADSKAAKLKVAEIKQNRPQGVIEEVKIFGN